MAHICLLYVVGDRPTADAAHRALVAAGRLVSRREVDGDTCLTIADDAAASVPPDAMIVFWSSASVASPSIITHARAALARRILTSVSVDRAEPPASFQHLWSIDLGEWDGAPDDSRWRFVLDEVNLCIRRREIGGDDASASALAAAARAVRSRRGLAGRTVLLGGVFLTTAATLIAVALAPYIVRRDPGADRPRPVLTESVDEAPGAPAPPVVPPPENIPRASEAVADAVPVDAVDPVGAVAADSRTPVADPSRDPALPNPEPDAADVPDIAGAAVTAIAEAAPVSSGEDADESAVANGDGVPDFAPDADQDATPDAAPDVIAELAARAASNATPATIEDALAEVAAAEAGPAPGAPDSFDPLGEASIPEPGAPEIGPALPPDPEDARPGEPVAPERAGARAEVFPAIEGNLFRDCLDCPDMAEIPGGQFMMGSPPDERARAASELPAELTFINYSFAISATEVTFDQWAACVADGACSRSAARDPGWGRGRRPAVNVSWRDAQNFVDWLTWKTGYKYRLPTEVEWEYAARAGADTPFSFGERLTTDLANFNGAYQYQGPLGPYRRQTTPVGSFPANGFGLFDMHGNVWEWVADCWSPDGAGTFAIPPAEPPDADACPERVLKGGAWNSGGWRLRAAHRLPGRVDAREYDNGFRVVRAL